MLEDLKKETRVLYTCARALEKLDKPAQERVIARLVAVLNKQQDLPL